MRPTTIKTRLRQMEAKVGELKGGYEKLSDFEYMHLASEVDFIKYVTPFEVNRTVDKYRRLWGRTEWLRFLKHMQRGNFWPSLTKKQQEILTVVPRLKTTEGKEDKEA